MDVTLTFEFTHAFKTHYQIAINFILNDNNFIWNLPMYHFLLKAKVILYTINLRIK